jgi:thiamine biosynthesis lipoprotein
MGEMNSRTFRAMGTDVAVIGPRVHKFPALIAAVRALVAVEERRFSRFRSDSELTRVNASSGAWVRPTPRFIEVLDLALDAARRTSGLFDPTVLGALVAVGYDRDFDDVIAGARATLHPVVQCGRWREIERHGAWVRLPPGVGVDLGGIVKGWTADLASARIADELGWSLVSLGGDLRLAGEPPEPLRVDVDDPDRVGSSLCSLLIGGGGLATSSTVRRSWGPGLHHLIDPRCGRSLRSETRQATAWAPTAAGAEVEAKRLLFAGAVGLDEVPGVVVTEPGHVITNLDTRAAA